MRGFTLIELLVVVVLICLLTGYVAFLSLGKATEKAQQETCATWLNDKCVE